jgi:hypothetical protein
MRQGPDSSSDTFGTPTSLGSRTPFWLVSFQTRLPMLTGVIAARSMLSPPVCSPRTVSVRRPAPSVAVVASRWDLSAAGVGGGWALGR